jgi:hypothetical protein
MAAAAQFAADGMLAVTSAPFSHRRGPALCSFDTHMQGFPGLLGKDVQPFTRWWPHR